MDERTGNEIEPTIETVETMVGERSPLSQDDAMYLLGLALGVARRHRAERDQLRIRAEEAERGLADLHRLINDSVAKVLDAAGPEDEDNPVIQRLRAFDPRGEATDG